MAEQVTAVDVDVEFLNRLKEADKSLAKLIKTTNNLSKSFSALANGPLDKVTSSIAAMAQKIDVISSKEMGDFGLAKLETKAKATTSKVVDDIAQVSQAVADINLDKFVEGDMLGQLRARMDFFTQELDRARENARNIALELTKSLSTGKYREGLGSDARDAEIHVNKLMESIKRTESLLKMFGASSSEAFGFMIKHANDASLEVLRLNAYYKDLEKISANAAKQSETAKKESANYADEWNRRQAVWEKGFDNYDEKLKEQAAKQSEAAKQESENWAVSYEERLRAWEQMFDSIQKSETAQVRDEYKSVLAELRNAEAKLEKSAGLKAQYGDDIHTGDIDNRLLEKQRYYNEQRERLEREHQAEISDLIEAEGKRRADNELDVAVKNAKEIIAKRNAIEKTRSEHLDTPQGAMAFSKTTKTIKQQIEAVEHLKKARENLNQDNFPSIRKYRKALREITDEINRQEESIRSLKGETEETFKVSGSLKAMLTNMVGLGAMKGYADQLVRVRGEFERQQVSLATLLQNKEAANRLWKQTLDLAITSPYTTAELITATKQLAAYRVEQHKLHSTTRMLTDLSSGLGVEVNRLVLAFGQVKAANFLRGTELRQFSEAGINILDALAERFTEIEGKAVSVSEVFERISRRKVLFADVEAVLEGMVSEGGAFYKMQEKQAETVYGIQRNLKDAVEIMYNEIGEMHEGAIKNYYGFLFKMIKNWRTLAEVITPVVAGFVAFRVSMATCNAIMSAGVAIQRLWVAVSGQAAATTTALGVSAAGAATGVRALNFALTANPIMLAITLLTTLGATLWGLSNSFDASADSAKTDMAIIDESTARAKRYSNAILNLTKQREDLLKIGERTEAQERQLNNVTSARTELLRKLTAENKEYARSLKGAGDSSEAMAKAIEAQEARLDATSAMMYRLSNYNWENISSGQKSQDIVTGAGASLMASMESGYIDETLEHYRSQLGNEMSKYSAEMLEETIKFLDQLKSVLSSESGDLGSDLAKLVAKFKNSFNVISFYLQNTNIAKDIKDIADNADNASDTLTATINKLTKDVEEILGGSWGDSMSNAIRSADVDVYNAALEQIQGTFKYIVENTNMSPDIQEKFAGMWAEKLGLGEGWLTQNIRIGGWRGEFNRVLKDLSGAEGITGLEEITSYETSIDDIQRKLTKAREQHESNIRLYEEWERTGKNGIQLISDSSYEESKKAIAYVIPELERLMGVKRKVEKDTRFTELTRSIVDVYKAYEKLENKFGKETAKAHLWKDYASVIDAAFKKVGKSADWVRANFNELTSEEDIKDLLQWVADNATTQDQRQAALRQVAEIELDTQIEMRDDKFRGLMDDIDETFSGYELSLELDKLNVPKDFAEDLFNIEIFNIEDLRNNIVKSAAAFDEFGKEGVEAYKEYLKKVDELESQAQEDRLKKYVEYTRKSIGERAQVMLSGLSELMDIEKTFTLTDSMALTKGLISEDQKAQLEASLESIQSLLNNVDQEYANDMLRIIGLTDEQIARLREENELLAEQGKLAAEASRRKTEESINKLDWDAVKSSDAFMSIMNDMDMASEKALDSMIRQLEGYKEQWKDMPYSDIKELADTLDSLYSAKAKFRSAREQRSILEGYLTDGVAIGDGEELIKFDSTAHAQESMIESSDKIQQLENELAIVEAIEALRAKGVTDEAELLHLTSQQGHAEDKIAKAMKTTSSEVKNSIKQEEKRLKAAKTVVDANEDLKTSYEQQIKAIQDAQKITDALFDAWDAINGLFKEGSLSAEIADMSKGILDGVLNTILMQQELFIAELGAKGFGAAMNAAMGPIGWIVLALETLVSLIKFGINQAEKAHQKILDEELKKIADLEEAYESLKDRIEDAYTAVDLGMTTKDAIYNLGQQIAAYDRLISSEEDWKKRDDEAIKDWKDKMDDLREEAENLRKEAFSSATDGILDDVISAARGFVDAWHDAFNETGDGMKGLENNFSEMMLNIVKQQATLAVMTPFINKLKDQLKKYINPDSGDLTLDTSEAEELRSWFEQHKVDMNESLENYFDSFKELYDTSGELSEFEKGIQGMTEDQAEVLAAYWNSCRFMLSNIDVNVARMATIMAQQDQAENPILSQLRAQTDILTVIKNMFSGVIDSSGNNLKVLLMN